MLEMSPFHKDKMMSDLRQVIHDAEEVIKVLAEQTGQEAEKLRGRMESRLSEARNELGKLQDQAAQHVRQAYHSTDEFVHHHPWATAGAAAGLGVVLGMLMARR
jgi:ElaB/YqjD/DUF883 family membrane-anchored ribosome-binding protein